MIRFGKWLENKENTALSPAQHKVAEIDKGLDDIVSNRLMQLAVDMETKGIGPNNNTKVSRQDVLKSIQRVIGTVKNQNQNQNKETGQANQTDPNMAGDATGQVDPNMLQQPNQMQQNPVT